MGVFALCWGVAAPAAARRDLSTNYRYEQVWGTVIRMLRVDYGFAIQDRDPETGYMLFDYVDSGRTYPGSFELLREGEGPDARVRVTVQVPAMPSYVERMLTDHLRQKLLRDYGAPPRRVRRPTPPTRDDEAQDDEETPSEGGANSSDD